MHAAASPPGPQTPQAYDTEFTLQLEKLRELLGTYLKAEDIERVAAAPDKPVDARDISVTFGETR